LGSGGSARTTERCLWTETAPLPSIPRSPLPASSDVVIIGGGYTGLSAARTFARRGIEVTVLEQHIVGWGASGRNGGFILPGYKPEMEELERRLGPERAVGMFRLTLDAIEHVAALIRDEHIDCNFVRCGAVTLAAKPGHVAALEASARFLQDRLGYQTELLGRTDVGREIDSRRYHGALVDPGACAVHPARYVRGMAASAARTGARIQENVQVLRIRRAKGGFEIVTRDAVIRTREVLAATNGYTPRALSSLRRRVIPIGSYQIATVPLPPELAQRLVPRGRVFSDTKNLLYYFRLSPDHRMVFGGRASFTPTGIARIAAILRAGMKEVFPQLSPVDIEFAWSGKVAYPLDHLPHVGRLDGVHYSMGYCGHGVALATYLGHRMAEVIAGDGQMPDLGSERFRALPFFNGFPWFLPLIGGYYRARDWVS
jgi:glycine/D-amino acid oxidase-like deaminating enzyme